jgi:hypothetical protein
LVYSRWHFCRKQTKQRMRGLRCQTALRKDCCPRSGRLCSCSCTARLTCS